MTWQIELAPDDATVRAYLAQFPVWSAYALADLRPPFRERSHYYLARRGDEWTILLAYRTTTFKALIAIGETAGLPALLKAVGPDLPAQCIISSGTGDQVACYEDYYLLGQEELMYRMVVTPETFKPFAGIVTCQTLGRADIPEMSGFYTMNNVPTFSPDQVTNGIYVGVRRHGMLVAVGGTHFIDRDDGMAAIGNVYTDAVLRGNGYASTIVSTLTERLFAAGCATVVLNVTKTNFSALRVYEALGFVAHALFWEAPARRKP